jgi:hypothetical protein
MAACQTQGTELAEVTASAIFFPVLQLAGVEITYEGVERNLGVINRRIYAKIVVVSRSDFMVCYRGLSLQKSLPVIREKCKHEYTEIWNGLKPSTKGDTFVRCSTCQTDF